MGEGLSLAEAEALGGLAVMATVHLLLRVAADDLRPLHFAAAERDLGRIHAEVSLRTDPAAHVGGASKSMSVERVDTARWFFEECGGLDHLRAAAGMHVTHVTHGRGAAGAVGLTSPVVTAAGQWAMRTLAEHWPEYINGGIAT